MIFDKIIRVFKGKKIILLGQNSSGKTTLNTFLREKRLVKEYDITSDLEKIKSSTYRKDKTKLHLKKGIDINGDEIYTKYWEFLITESAYCLFIFDTSKLLKNDRETIIYLTKYLPYAAKLAEKYSTKLFLIGNFTDRILNFNQNRQEVKNRLRPRLINAIDDANIDFNSIIFGNMSSKETIFELIDTIFKNIRIDGRKKRINAIIGFVVMAIVFLIIATIYYYKTKY